MYSKYRMARRQIITLTLPYLVKRVLRSVALVLDASPLTHKLRLDALADLPEK